VDAADQGMTPQRHEEVEERLRLAKGFLATTELLADANEYEIRNALSRCYYAMYHVCNALLAAKGDPPRTTHKDLQKEIRRSLGDPFSDNLKKWQVRRERADYESDWVAQAYSGDVKQFRDAAVTILEEVRTEFERYGVLITTEEAKSEAPDERG
jgi:uncharacterized protein (UPF0332 family)